MKQLAELDVLAAANAAVDVVLRGPSHGLEKAVAAGVEGQQPVAQGHAVVGGKPARAAPARFATPKIT